ncbi:hypothetical protein Droror1_Dr00028313 [Drosera rotundifolia]
MHSRLPALEKALFDYRERQEVSKRRSERCHTIDFRYRADTGFFDPTDEVYTGAGNAPTPTNAGTKTGGNETSSKESLTSECVSGPLPTRISVSYYCYLSKFFFFKACLCAVKGEPGYGKNRAVGKDEQGLTFQGEHCTLWVSLLKVSRIRVLGKGPPRGERSEKDQTVCPQIGRAWQRLPSGRLASSDNSSDTDIADDRVPPVSGPSTVASGSIPPTPAIDQQPLPPPGFPVPLHSAPQGHLDLLPQMMAMMESVNSRMSQFEDTLRNLSAQQQQFQQAPVSLPFFPTPGALCGSCIRILSIPGAHH